MHIITEIYEKEILGLFDVVKEEVVHLNAFLKREIKNDECFLLENMKRFDNNGISYESTKWLRKMKAHKAPNNEIITSFYLSLINLNKKDKELVEREMNALITDEIKKMVDEFLSLFEGENDILSGSKLFEWVASRVGIEDVKELYTTYKMKRGNGEFKSLEELSNNDFKKMHKLAMVKSELSDFEKMLFEKKVREAVLEKEKPTDKQFKYLIRNLREKGYKLVNNSEMLLKDEVGKLIAWCKDGKFEDEIKNLIEEIKEGEMEQILYESPNIKATQVVEAVKEFFAHVPKFKFSTKKHKELVEKFKAKEDATLAEVRESDFGEYLVYSQKWIDFVKAELGKEVVA